MNNQRNSKKVDTRKTNAFNKNPSTKRLDSTSRMVSKTTTRVQKITQPTPLEEAKKEKQQKRLFKLKYYMFVSIPFLFVVFLILLIFKPFASVKKIRKPNTSSIVIPELELLKDYTYQQKRDAIRNWTFEQYRKIARNLDEARRHNPDVYKQEYEIIIGFKEFSDDDYNKIGKIKAKLKEARDIADKYQNLNVPPEEVTKIVNLNQEALDLCDELINKYPNEWPPKGMDEVKALKNDAELAIAVYRPK